MCVKYLRSEAIVDGQRTCQAKASNTPDGISEHLEAQRLLEPGHIQIQATKGRCIVHAQDGQRQLRRAVDRLQPAAQTVDPEGRVWRREVGTQRATGILSDPGVSHPGALKPGAVTAPGEERQGEGGDEVGPRAHRAVGDSCSRDVQRAAARVRTFGDGR